MRPFPPSWIDHLIDRIARLPAPAWVAYLLIMLSFMLLNNLVFWIEGSLAPGSFNFQFTFGAVYVVYGMVFYHYSRGVAAKSVHDFYPVLEKQANEEPELEYRMTHIPAVWGWIALALGTTSGVFDVMSSQYEVHFQSAFYRIYVGAVASFNYATFIGFVVLTTRQLLTVVRLHNRIAEVDLFNLNPIRAFSRLTATSGFAVFFLGAFSALVYMKESDAALHALYLVIVLIGLLIFILPLVSVRTRINKEKKAKLLEVDQRIKHTLGEIRQSVHSGDLSSMGDLNNTLSVLEKERSIFKRISSYPWDPGTLKSFISTILLPLLIWWVKNLLEKWL